MTPKVTRRWPCNTAPGKPAVHHDIEKYVYAKDMGLAKPEDVGQVLYNRGCRERDAWGRSDKEGPRTIWSKASHRRTSPVGT